MTGGIQARKISKQTQEFTQNWGSDEELGKKIQKHKAGKANERQVKEINNSRGRTAHEGTNRTRCMRGEFIK